MVTAIDKDKLTKGAVAEAEPVKKKSKKKLIIIALVVLLVGGGAYKFMMPAKKPLPGAKKPAPKPGPIVTPDAVTVDLSGGHYLRIGLALQFTSKVSATTLPDGSAALDQTVSYLTGQNAATLETAAGLASVRAALNTRITAVYPTDPILAVLITSFVIQ